MYMCLPACLKLKQSQTAVPTQIVSYTHTHTCKCVYSENTKRDSVKLAAQLHKRNLQSKYDSNRVNKISFG